MTEPRRAGGTPDELARALRDRARAAATAALRAGLEEIDERHGRGVADQVAALIDVAEVFAGLTERAAPAPPSARQAPTPVREAPVRSVTRERRPSRDDDEEPWEFQPLTTL
ncbi:hypothetical protein ACWEOE_31205 [Amycolatopsis sp. NPDC004368]